jgi:hypothetical protein
VAAAGGGRRFASKVAEAAEADAESAEADDAEQEGASRAAGRRLSSTTAVRPSSKAKNQK